MSKFSRSGELVVEDGCWKFNHHLVCVLLVPENRPVMKEVLRMIKETRAETTHVSSNSSDHSPVRYCSELAQR
ncbi:hypothetical protein HanIR_Chr11g0554931 [Helianthus annuus]|nr:hypothetical protein HanIR_Chr11g0554931 [Helianthus annuus]